MNIVVGAGPVGREVARTLAAVEEEVVLVTRNPQAVPGIDGVTAVAGDITKPQSLVQRFGEAAVLFHCANAPYHKWESELPAMWHGAIQAAEGLGARLVVATNLYAYGSVPHPMSEDESLRPISKKGRIRAILETEIVEAGKQGRIETVLVRASDFYGPEVLVSALGDRFFEPILAGKKATFYGDLRQPHSYTYLPDFAKTVVAAGKYGEAGGQTWHAPNSPALSPLDMVSELSAIFGRSVTANRMPKAMLKAAGLFIPEAREMVEMLYEFERPFITSSAISEDSLDLHATPISEGLKETVAWYRARSEGNAA